MHVIFGYVLVVFSSLMHVLPSLHIYLFAIWFLWFGCVGQKKSNSSSWPPRDVLAAPPAR